MTPTMERRKLNAKDIESRYFVHQYTAGGVETGFLGVLLPLDDGYVRVAEFTQKGLRVPFLTLWSGCLRPDHEMPPERQQLLAEARKIA